MELQGHHCFKNSTPSMEPIPNEVEKTKQRNSDQDERHEERPVVFLLSVHAEKLALLLRDYADVCCKYAHYERHENVLRIPNPRFPEQNSLKRSTANIFQREKGNVLSLILDQKMLTKSAPRGLLCAVASERRRAKWKAQSESVGCASVWKRLTSETRTACST